MQVHSSLHSAFQRYMSDESMPSLKLLSSIEETICNNKIKQVGIVTRRGRRKLAKEWRLVQAVVESIPDIEVRMIDFGVRSITNSYNATNIHGASKDMAVEITIDGSVTAVSAEKITMAGDILGIQDLSVLIGVQVDIVHYFLQCFIVVVYLFS